MTSRSPRVVVVGGGVFGAATALELRTRGWAVTLLDPHPLPYEEASSTDVSKVIRMDYGSDAFYHEFAERALEGWDRWNVEAGRRLYHEDGFLVLARGPMTPGGFEHESWRVLNERGYRTERVAGDTLRRRYPAWRDGVYVDGYFNPRAGWAESGAVVEWLITRGRSAGVEVRADAISGEGNLLLGPGGRVRGVRTREGVELGAEVVVVCAGAWTPVLLPWLSDRLTAVAQPVLYLGVEEPDTFAPGVFPPWAADIAGSGWYGFPALPDGRVKVGHHGRGRRVQPDERGEVDTGHLERARSFLREAIPRLADAPLVGSRVCLYCDSFDGDFLIDRDPEREGLVVASGGSGHAFKFAPLLGELVADAVEGRENRWSVRFRWRGVGGARTEEARFSDA